MLNVIMSFSVVCSSAISFPHLMHIDLMHAFRTLKFLSMIYIAVILFASFLFFMVLLWFIPGFLRVCLRAD